MPKYPEDPLQWLPDPDLPNAECDLLQLWSRYHKEIATYRNFQSRDETLKSYTGALKIIEDSLMGRPCCQLSVFDIWDMARSVPGRLNSKNEYIEYSHSTLMKRITILRDILLYAEARTICFNPLQSSILDLFKKCEFTFDQASEEVKNVLRERYKNKLLPRYLNTTQEQKLMRKILAHIEEDGRWLGMAVLLWCGVRASELRGLRFADIKTFFDLADRRYICFCRSSQTDGTEKPDMKNQYGPRSIPEHIELHYIIEKRMHFIKKATGKLDISDLPAITTGNNFEQTCTSTDLMIFVKNQLQEVFDKEHMAELMILHHLADTESESGIDGDIPENPADLAADLQLGTRLARRNFCTKNYAETLLEDWQSRLTMGHKTEYNTAFPYSEGHLLEMLHAMDHRMIMPEIHSGWHTIFSPGMEPAYQDDVGVHYLSVPAEQLTKVKKICIDIDLDNAGDNFLLEFFRKFPVEAIKISTEYFPKRGLKTLGRTNTDAAHWPLSWAVAQKDLEKRNE